MTTSIPAPSFTYADDRGGRYRVTYSRDQWGRHAWEVRPNKGPGEVWATLRNQDRDLSPAEIARHAAGFAASVALNRGGLELDADGSPIGFVRLAG